LKTNAINGAVDLMVMLNSQWWWWWWWYRSF